MATRSRKKILMRVGLVALALFVLVLVLVPLLVPAERWKQIAFDRLRAETGPALRECTGVTLERVN